MGSDPAHYHHNHIYLDGLKSYERPNQRSSGPRETLEGFFYEI